jgi:hypothetical protein
MTANDLKTVALGALLVSLACAAIFAAAFVWRLQ